MTRPTHFLMEATSDASVPAQVGLDLKISTSIQISFSDREQFLQWIHQPAVSASQTRLCVSTDPSSPHDRPDRPEHLRQPQDQEVPQKNRVDRGGGGSQQRAVRRDYHERVSGRGYGRQILQGQGKTQDIIRDNRLNSHHSRIRKWH